MEDHKERITYEVTYTEKLMGNIKRYRKTKKSHLERELRRHIRTNYKKDGHKKTYKYRRPQDQLTINILKIKE